MRLTNTVLRLALLVWLGNAGPRLFAAEISVFGAASLTDALQEIAPDYQKQTGDKIVFNFAGSSTLARQIEAGAPADIFFSADERQMDRLEGKGQMAAGTRRDLLSNSLVIVVAAKNGANVHSPKDLADPGIRRITLGDPQTVPIGVYAREYLEKLELWKAIAPKVVPTENVRGALAAVEEGNADASIVYKTDALISKRVVVAYAVPVEQGPAIRYPVALVRGTKQPEASRRFLEYLAGKTAAKIFEKRGFVVLNGLVH